MKIRNYILLTIAGFLIIVGCNPFKDEKVKEKHYFNLDVSQLDTAAIDEIIIYAEDNDIHDTLYTWTKGEKLDTKIFIPGRLGDQFTLIFIGKINGVVELAQSMELDKDKSDMNTWGTDVPGLKEYIKFSITSPMDSTTLGIRNVTISGSIKSEYDLDVFQINGVAINPTGESWTKSVSLEDGENEFLFVLLDRIGNRVYDTLIIIYSENAVDTTGPVFSGIFPVDSATVSKTPVSLYGKVSDAAGSISLLTVDGDTVQVDGADWTASVELTEGLNEIILLAVDNDTNLNSTELVHRIDYDPTAEDNTGPVLTIDAPKDSDEVVVDSVTVRGTAQDNNGITSVKVNGLTAVLVGNSWSKKIGLDENDNKILVIATDASSNKNKTKDSITVIYDKTVEDTTLPTVEIITPANNATFDYQTGIPVEVSADDLSDISSVLVNGDTAVYVASINKWTVDIDLAEVGANVITAVAEDTKGNRNSDAISVTYTPPPEDSIPPVIAITSPSNNTVVSNPSGVTVSGTATDGSGITSVTVNGTGAIYAGGAWTATIDLPRTVRNNPVKAIATDARGNKDSSSINIIFDSTVSDITPPSITLSSHTSGQTVGAASVLIQATVTDAQSGVGTVTINGVAATLNAGKYEGTITLVPGVNSIRILASDNIANHNLDTLDFSLIYYSLPAGMKLIPAGTFSMGQRGVAEPVHSVTLSAFYMDSTEVTQADFTALMSQSPSSFTGDTKRPVENMTWFDAVLYCNKRSKRDGLDTVYSYTSVTLNAYTGVNVSALGSIAINYAKNGYRLPTEAEWEYAARAGTTTDYYWGNNPIGNYAWYDMNSSSTTHPVGQKLPNAWGLYDMSGNVWEWVGDWSASYIAGSATNPTGPTSGTVRVVRGGSWSINAFYLRSAYRGGGSPGNGHGFRCVRPQ